MPIDRKIKKNSLNLLFLEWIIWVIVAPVLIIYLISLFIDVPFFELIQSLGPGGKNAHFMMGHLFFVGLIFAPIFSYFGFLTRPVLKMKKAELEFEMKKKEIIDIINRIKQR